MKLPFNPLEQAQIVAEARTWLGTPFHHQGRLKGVGVDCAGVAIGTAKNCGFHYDDVLAYSRIPRHGLFRNAIFANTDQVEPGAIELGDLILFQWVGEPQHVAIVSSLVPLRIVHAWQDAGKCVENDMDETWRSRLTDVRRLRRTDQ